MRRPAVAPIALLLTACAPAVVPTGELPTGTAFPASYRGLWADAPAACLADPVRIGARGLTGLSTDCTVRTLRPAAGGGLVADMACTANGRAYDDLVRLSVAGDAMTYRNANGEARWTRC